MSSDEIDRFNFKYGKESHADEIAEIERCEICLGTTAQGIHVGEFVVCLSCATLDNIQNLKEDVR